MKVKLGETIAKVSSFPNQSRTVINHITNPLPPPLQRSTPEPPKMADAKTINSQAYNHLASWYLDWVSTQSSTSPRETYALKVLEPKRSEASSPPSILELGCGPGIPITRLLLDQGAHVLANDISPEQIKLAKVANRSPRATFVGGDMAALSLPAASFDGVVCFFTLFHLPRAEQKPMLSKIHEWLKPGGLLVCNFATFDEEEIYGEMMGHGIFWSGFGVEGNREMLTEVGFEAEREDVLESEVDGGNEFQWIAARKRVG
jgi:SAM-dependent methyltransferase